MSSISGVAELTTACKARGFDPINLSGLAYILKVCEVRRFKYKNSDSWRYELLYRGRRAYGTSVTDANSKRRR